MKTTKSFLVAAVALAAITAYTSPAQAQTESVTATVTVQNALTLDVPQNLNFGTVSAVSSHATNTASLALHPVTNILTPTNSLPEAAFAIIDSTAAQAAHVTVAGGAPGGTLNLTIDNVVAPTYTDPLTADTTAFTLAGWSTSWNGGTVAPQVAGTSWTRVYDGAITPNQLNIGATLTTVADTVYPDQTYAGSFDVTVAY